MNHIDQSILKQAAENLTTICDAGYEGQIRRDLAARLAESPQARATWTDPIRDLELSERAKLLALVLDAPLPQCLAAVSAASGDHARRQLGLRLLEDMAGQVRRLQSARARRAG